MLDAAPGSDGAFRAVVAQLSWVAPARAQKFGIEYAIRHIQQLKYRSTLRPGRARIALARTHARRLSFDQRFNATMDQGTALRSI